MSGAQERAERLQSGNDEPDYDVFHLATLFAATLRPDDWPGDIDDSFPPALRALLRTDAARRSICTRGSSWRLVSSSS